MSELRRRRDATTASGATSDSNNHHRGSWRGLAHSSRILLVTLIPARTRPAARALLLRRLAHLLSRMATTRDIGFVGGRAQCERAEMAQLSPMHCPPAPPLPWTTDTRLLLRLRPLPPPLSPATLIVSLPSACGDGLSGDRLLRTLSFFWRLPVNGRRALGRRDEFSEPLLLPSSRP